MSYYHFSDHPEFQPNYSPYEVIAQGAFGGTYFRDIYSSVNKRYYRDSDLEFDWVDIPREKLIMPWNQYNKESNKYKVKVGTTLEFWENHGWINSQDPYGWFQWYCRFWLGRRTDDDRRQIQRWNSFKNRFGKRINKTPKIKQTLLHWAINPEL